MPELDSLTVSATLPKHLLAWKNAGAGRRKDKIKQLEFEINGVLYDYEACWEPAPSYTGHSGSMHYRLRWVLYKYGGIDEDYEPVEHDEGTPVAADTLIDLSRWIKRSLNTRKK